MYCSKCGVELKENAKYCSKCGTEIIYRKNEELNEKIYVANEECDEILEEYLILNSLKAKERKILNIVVKIIAYVFYIYFSLAILSHIGSEINEAQGYRFLLYFIRFVIFVSPLAAVGCIVEPIVDIIPMKKSQLKANINYKTFLLCKIAIYVLSFISYIMLGNPTTGEIVNIFAIFMIQGSFFDYISIVKVPVILWVCAVILNIFCEDYFLVKENNEINNN